MKKEKIFKNLFKKGEPFLNFTSSIYNVEENSLQIFHNAVRHESEYINI